MTDALRLELAVLEEEAAQGVRRRTAGIDLEGIFVFLPRVALVKAGRCCRAWQRLTQTAPELKKRLLNATTVRTVVSVEAAVQEAILEDASLSGLADAKIAEVITYTTNEMPRNVVKRISSLPNTPAEPSFLRVNAKSLWKRVDTVRIVTKNGTLFLARCSDSSERYSNIISRGGISEEVLLAQPEQNEDLELVIPQRVTVLTTIESSDVATLGGEEAELDALKRRCKRLEIAYHEKRRGPYELAVLRSLPASERTRRVVRTVLVDGKVVKGVLQKGLLALWVQRVLDEVGASSVAQLSGAVGLRGWPQMWPELSLLEISTSSMKAALETLSASHLNSSSRREAFTERCAAWIASQTPLDVLAACIKEGGLQNVLDSKMGSIEEHDYAELAEELGKGVVL